MSDNIETNTTNVETPTTGPFPELTYRERQVALLLVEGLTNREIAEKIDISIKTVDTHRGHVIKKLKLRNNVELVRLAVKQGYITI